MTLEEYLDSILSSSDLVVISIRGQIAIESALVEVIKIGLPKSNHVELKRISYRFKVDLAVALNGLRKDSTPLFYKLNAIRNGFAHNIKYSLGDEFIQDIKSSLSEFQRGLVGEHFESAKTPRKAMIVATCAAFYEARAVRDHLVRKSIHKEAWLEEVKLLLDRLGSGDENISRSDNSFSRRLDERIKEKLKGKAGGGL